MVHRFSILCCLMVNLIQSLEAEAFFSVKFLTFRNARGLNDRGRCCDNGNSTCLSPCDHSFTICLDQIDGSKTDIGSCIYGRQVSSEIVDSNIINFYHRIGNLANPIIWRLPMWPGQVLLKIDVVDIDHHKAPDHVAYLAQRISFLPQGGHHVARFKIGRHVELMFEARIYCGRNYYGYNCSTPCIPRDDDARGHYSCDLTNGSKICMAGWTGEHCVTKKNVCAGVTCVNGGTCQALSGMFECACLDGYEGRFCEAEINECLSSEVCQHGKCVNTPGSFTCTCFPGYTGETCATNIDDCLESPCQNGALCIDHVKEFECSCLAGYTGKTCGADINECQMNPCKHNGTCINLVGDYRCRCLPGYEGNDCSLDTDECLNSNLCLNQGICINQLGGYTCQCPVGFQGVHCESDVNECQNVNICHNHGICVNTHGSFTCVCQDEYFGPKCEYDVNECLNKPCKNGGQCQNLLGGYVCHCPDEYTGKVCDADVNKCLKDVCKHGGNCTNVAEGFQCTCSQFWTGVTCEQNINECLSSPCRHGGACKDVDEGFTCICQAGFKGRLCESTSIICDLRRCENISICMNGTGSDFCECPEGWRGQSCQEDMSKCEIEICNNNGTCLNTEGGFQCDCPVYWTGQQCELDVNECEMLTNPCKNEAVCNNMVGSYNCECLDGWTGNLCSEDVNECEQDPQICQTLITSKAGFLTLSNNISEVHVTCQNTIPGYVCACDKGWTGVFCNEDFDECQGNPFICSLSISSLETSATDPKILPAPHRVCLNTQPGYKCMCADGQKCHTQTHHHNRASTSTDARQNNSHKEIGTDSDKQHHDCNNSDCRMSVNANQTTDFHNTIDQAVANTIVINPSSIFENENDTKHLTGNDSDTLVSLYLDCEISLGKRSIIDKALEQFFWDTHLFLGKHLSVSHRSQVWTSPYGKFVTTIIPVVEVDARILSNPEVSAIIHSVTHKLADYIDCSSFQDGAKSGASSWFPGFISVCALAIVFVVSLALFKCLSRIRNGKKQTFNIRSLSVSRSFRNETYKTRSADSTPTDQDSSPDQEPIRSLVKMLDGQENLNRCSQFTKHNRPAQLVVENVPGRLSRILYDIPKENESQDHDVLQTALQNTCSSVTAKEAHVKLSQSQISATDHQLSRAEYSTPVSKYVNISNMNDADASKSLGLENRHRAQALNSSEVNNTISPYVEMLSNKQTEVKADNLHQARDSQKIVVSTNIMTVDIEKDKYKALPYIDDPGYTEIITKEEQEMAFAKQCLK